jgi:hypothetical protein
MTMHSILRGLGALALVLLAACGGGGGGDEGPTGVQVPQGVRSGTASASSAITEGNFQSFAGPLARAVMSAGDAKTVPGVSNGREAPQARNARLARQGQRWVRLALGSLSSREQPLGTITRPARCPLGGALTLTLDDADDNGKLSAGDRVSIVTLACVSEPGQPASTGSLSLSINAIELDGNDDPTALDVTITFSGFEEEGFGTLSGAVRLWFKEDGSGGEQLRLSYSATAVTEQGDSVAYDFDITGGSDAGGGGTFDLNGTFIIGSAAYAMTSTTFAFSGGSSHPASGSVTLRDFLGNTLTLRARGDTFDLEFRPFGAPLPLIIPGFLWSVQRLGPG